MPEQENWERQTLEKLVFAALEEQRSARRWSIFFRLLTFGFLLLAFVVIGGGLSGRGDTPIAGEHTALVDLQGIIAPGAEANADKIITGLQQAFEDEHTKGVILRINSPGGSPVQAGYINDEIKRLRTKYPGVPLYVVVEDICASGGYYVAVAADKIFVDKASIVGSIGVLINGFGFTGSMEKLGVERRLLMAGENKGFLDPFSPTQAKQQHYAQNLLNEIHQQFIAAVRQGRGSRLRETSDMFSGLIWTGEKSIQMGLADALGNADYVAREIIKAEDIIDFTPQEGLAERFAKRLGFTLAQHWASFAVHGIAIR